MMIESTETRNAKSGFVEMAFYSPEIEPGKGRVMRAVISRQCRGGKWCVYAAGLWGCELKTPVKKRAVDAARMISEDNHARAVAGLPPRSHAEWAIERTKAMGLL